MRHLKLLIASFILAALLFATAFISTSSAKPDDPRRSPDIESEFSIAE